MYMWMREEVILLIVAVSSSPFVLARGRPLHAPLVAQIGHWHGNTTGTSSIKRHLHAASSPRFPCYAVYTILGEDPRSKAVHASISARKTRSGIFA